MKPIKTKKELSLTTIFQFSRFFVFRSSDKDEFRIFVLGFIDYLFILTLYQMTVNGIEIPILELRTFAIPISTSFWQYDIWCVHLIGTVFYYYIEPHSIQHWIQHWRKKENLCSLLRSILQKEYLKRICIYYALVGALQIQIVHFILLSTKWKTLFSCLWRCSFQWIYFCSFNVWNVFFQLHNNLQFYIFSFHSHFTIVSIPFEPKITV